MKTVDLTVDSKNRVSLTKLIKAYGRIDNLVAVRAHIENETFVLEPMVKIPAREMWLYKNKEALKRVEKGLSQTPRKHLGSFAKYVQD